jgi:hypothetical protein
MRLVVAALARPAELHATDLEAVAIAVVALARIAPPHATAGA